MRYRICRRTRVAETSRVREWTVAWRYRLCRRLCWLGYNSASDFARRCDVATFRRQLPRVGGGSAYVTSVWWAAKRALKALLDGVSTSSRARVHIYKSGDSGTEKLLDHFARHQLPSCIAGGTCKCRRCKSLPHRANGSAREKERGETFRGEMNASQRRQYVRHHFVYLVGLCAFYPMHFARMTAHPFLVSAVKLDSRMSRRTRIMVWRTVMALSYCSLRFGYGNGWNQTRRKLRLYDRLCGRKVRRKSTTCNGKLSWRAIGSRVVSKMLSVQSCISNIVKK